MKFEQIKNLTVPEKTYSKKELKKSASSLNIKSIRRYGEMSVILMYPETKENLTGQGSWEAPFSKTG